MLTFIYNTTAIEGYLLPITFEASEIQTDAIVLTEERLSRKKNILLKYMPMKMDNLVLCQD